MNAIQIFFQKYNAAPATDAGVTWSEATDAVLMNWARQYTAVVSRGWNLDAKRPATQAEQKACKPMQEEIYAEIKVRAARAGVAPEVWIAAQK
jgi:hypothetical protein